jgi:hypothetical protein
MAIKPSALIITNREDFAADYLILKMMEVNLPCLRINSEDVDKWSIKYDPSDQIEIKYEDNVFELKDVKGIYFRRAPSIFNHFNDEKNASYLWRECREFFEGIYLTLNAKWINPIFETYKAERKLYQLRLAVDIGFKTPKSVITNDPNIIKSFISKQESIIKPISHGLQISDSDVFSIYTNRISPDIEMVKPQYMYKKKYRINMISVLRLLEKQYFRYQLEKIWIQKSIGVNQKL